MELDTSGINKKLICIEYPGIVKNVDNMLKTLGGLPEISKVFQSTNRRLELRFRPDDLYCKPACGDKTKTNRLLLRIKVSLVKNKTTGETTGKGSVEIVARVLTTFKFKSLCDFQYLPVHSSSEGKLSDLTKEMLPTDISGDNLMAWLERPIECHFLPPAFARVDNLATNSYMYRGSGKDENEDIKVIGRTRKRRSGHGIFVNFDVEKVPQKPREKALKFLHVKLLSKQYKTVKECFDKRPVWSKLALMCETQLSHDTLKDVLPATAYYFLTGPYRSLWVKFGYDPRSDPDSKIYQVLDYRIRSLDGLTCNIKAKRNTTSYKLPNKTTTSIGKTPVISMKSLSEGLLSKESEVKVAEHVFTPTTVPNTRQMFYQYVDIKLPEVEALFARLPKNPTVVCDPRTGFLPRGFDNHCRDVISLYITKQLKQRKKDANVDDNDDDFSDDEEDEDDMWHEEDADIDESDDEDQ